MQKTAWKWRVAVGLVLFLALGLRLATTRPSLMFIDRPMLMDEVAYWGAAQAILDGTLAAEDLLRPYMRVPGYAAIIAASLKLFGPITLPVEVLQAIVGTASVLLTALLARQYIGPRAALWAAFLVAIQPAVIVFTHFLMTETLSQFVILAILWLLAVAHHAPARSWVWRLAAGALVGAFTLVRTQILTLAVPIMLWWFMLEWRRSRDWRRTLLQFCPAAAMALVLILPWAIRNYRVHGSFPLLDTHAAFNLAFSNSGLHTRQLQADIYQASPTPAGRQAYALKVAREWIVRHPGEFRSKALKNAWALWQPEYPDPYELREKYPGISDSWLALYADSKIVWLSAVGLLAIWGLFCFPSSRAGSRPFHLLVVLVLLVHTLMIAILHVEGRFGYPLYPLLAILAVAGALGLSQWRSWTGFLAGVVAVVYFMSSVWPGIVVFGPQIAAVRALNMGDAAAARGDVPAARAAFERARALQPDWSRPWLALGNLFVTRDYEAARRAYMEAQATRPDDYRAYLALHRLAARYGRPPPEEPPSSVLSVALRVAWKGPAPARQVVDVGSFDLGAIDGFYQSEATEDGTSVRWSRPHARLRIGGLRPESPAMLLIRLRTSSLVEDKRALLIQSGGITVGQFQLSARWRTYHVLVPRTDAAGVAEVELSMPSLFISNYLPTGDKRNLGVQVDGFSKASLHEQSRQTMSIDVQR